jgi:FxsC-like protein
MTCWFFMSYARADNDPQEGEYVRTFYDGLRKEVASKVTDQSPPIGFIDEKDLQPGDSWPVEIAEAVCHCRTFVPIMTARYFTREYCGREWAIFEDRCRNCSGSGKLPPLIIPVLWDRPEEGQFPEYAWDLHRDFDPETVPKEEREKFQDYAKYGLLWVIKRKEGTHGTVYATILDQLARRIIQATTHHQIAALQGNTPPSLKDVTSRFHLQPPPTPSSAAPSATRKAHFAFVAGTEKEMTNVRANARQYYGAADARDWTPYAPQDTGPIAFTAQSAATELGLYCEWLLSRKDFVKSLRAAEELKSVALMIVDPWAVRLPECAQLLAEFDQYQFLNCAVLVVWNPDDPQTQAEREALRSAVQRTLCRCFICKKAYLKEAVKTPADLRAEIAESLRVLEGVLAPYREPVREVAQGGREAPPTVSASGGTT